MRGWVIAAVLLFIIAGPALPQCDYHVQFSGEFRASVFDIAIDGNDLWTATGYGVQLYDLTSNPPQLTGSISAPGLTRVVRALNGVAYAAGTNGIAVIRRNVNRLELVRTIPIGVVNDLALQGAALFAATPAGIMEFDLVDRLNPTKSAATFPTSTAAVTSIAILGSTLYVADGDSTIEAFSVTVPSSPQKVQPLTSALTRVATVEAIGNRLYASDGQRTDVFIPTGAFLGSAGLLPFAANAIADLGANVVATAGSDRQLRVIDASVPQSFIELFDDELPPTAGTVNRVTAMKVANGKLYVAGGDSGLSIYDVSHFSSPFPLRAYASGPTTSVVTLTNAIYFGRPSPGIQEMTRSSSGLLVTARQWSSSVEVVQDGATGFLLTSNGATAKLWTLTSSVPTLISSATFRAAIRRAVLDNLIAVALLEDGTIWTADMSHLNPTPVRFALDFGTVAQIAHSPEGFAATEINADSTTTLHFSTAAAGPIVNTKIDGVATALALGGDVAAVFTFRGITVVRGNTQVLLAGSNTDVVQALDVANGRVIALTDSGVIRIWNLSSGKLEKEFAVPGGAVAIDAAQDSTVIGIATPKGAATLDYGVSTSQPQLTARLSSNTYYKKAAASTNRIYLFDGRVIDVFESTATGAPRWLTSILAAGVIDLAASDTNLFTLTSSQIINAYSNAGVLLRSQVLNEGADVTPLAIDAVAGAPWVSFSRGCTTTGCEKRTDVLDPQSLVRTATLQGGVIDVTTSGTRAYAIFDLPSETRVYNVTDALHPAPVVTRATDVNAVAIAYDNGTVYLLADKAYAYSESTLTRTGERLSATTPSAPAGFVISNGCATIAGRTPNGENYELPGWTGSSNLGTPGSIRTLALSGGRMVILTDYSIEIWSRAPVSKIPKRRGVAP